MASPVTRDAIEAALAAASSANAHVKCFIDFDPDGALAAAGKEGALQGLIGAIKGNIAMAGLPNTGGSAARCAEVAASDASVVTKLRAAGAALLGTLNLHEGALGATTRNEAFGWCENPWRQGHTPGGSSGGSGAAVAAGLVDFALGTDTLGSIRIPAAYCGLFGFKPGGDWLAQDGIIPLKADYDQVGPLARDPAVLLAVAAVLGAPAPVSVAGKRFGILDGWGEVPSAIAGLVGQGSERLRDAGAKIVPITLATDLDPQTVLLDSFTLCAREAADQHWAREFADAGSGISSDFRFLMSYGARADADRLRACEHTVERVRAAVSACINDQQLEGFICPTAPETAFAHGAEPPLQAGFTALASLAGLPAVSVPIGLVDGLPVGMQIVGAPGGDGLVLGAASLFEPLPMPSRWW